MSEIMGIWVKNAQYGEEKKKLFFRKLQAPKYGMN